MKICSLLLAKGNSSFKNKNIYPKLGHPLTAYPMLAAKNVNLISDCFISSDSKQYLKIGEKYGYTPILRSPELAQDSSKSDDVVLDSVLNNDILKNSEIIIVQHANVGTVYPELINKSIEILLSNKISLPVIVYPSEVIIFVFPIVSNLFSFLLYLALSV